ncbi:MAG: hypothetical protein NZ869_09300 [Thermoanaerobaculum sp.]|nr:hypothetical protein [Thermoanaerobaculum sp.]MDW7968234.1 hypothetical protein [Thermoanaerobaculum sp.]
MAKPDYIICLECESEVEDFTWRDGEIRRATCEVCGNTDPDSFALPEGFTEEEEDEWGEEDEEEEEEYPEEEEELRDEEE